MNNLKRMNNHKLDLPSTTVKRASVLEQLCKSASRHTPLSEFSATFKLHGTPDLYQSVPNGLLEHMDLRSTLNLNDDGGKELRASYICVDEVKCAFEGVLYSDCVPYTDARFGWSFKKPYMSPIGKLWDRISSNSSSSGKQRSLNPELTCFPIEEDPSISGENENIDEVADTIQEDISSTLMTRAKRQPLAEIKEACVNPPTSVSAAERFLDRNSLDSTNTEVSATGAQSGIKQKLAKIVRGSLSVSTNCIKKATESLNNRFSKPKLSGKTSLRKGGQNLLERESKRNNIVSNITSFLPLVQQKQAAAVGTGKRDIKVKALEAAKRLEEKRQNERKLKKDALKLERERKEQENLRQMEINKKKKEEEQKKKDADMAARKRLREEEERKEKERKRKRIEEPRQQQRGKEEKLRAEKEKEVPFGAMDENVNDGKESNNELRKHQKMKKPQTDPRAAEISTSNASQVILKDCQAFSHFGDNGEPTSVFTKTAEKDSFMAKTSLEKSYSISPYQCSDDEEDEEDERDEIHTKKFVPSWASKNSVALVLSSQQKVDPYIIFPPESFCSIDEVLRPQKLQPK
ncbi:DNA ligase 1-like [Camellia sinensis]|uniref:DNA ligase 1-like n=1 Tax=Camellia sinensis TaxID=4442 RepID=UPI00103597D5|nr:DNA ligase 1-like [Camellia sinensis]